MLNPDFILSYDNPEIARMGIALFYLFIYYICKPK